MKLAVSMLAMAACGGDLDPPWQLDHDRIIAVRADPPGIAAGETSQLDALVAVKGGPTTERPPDVAVVVSPRSLAAAVAPMGGGWQITAPDEAGLAAARTELGLAAGAPVPLQIGVCFAGDACLDPDNKALIGLKTVTLGLAQPNPAMPPATIDDAAAPPPATEIVVADLTIDVPLHIDAGEQDDVNWLTSAGTMHDDDLPTARISFETDDPTEGELALVFRDEHGGVTWQTWPIRAATP